jgi:glycosyltransferase involved in cell wall biosynthesis
MIIRQANAGPGAARNNGIRHADGELIAFLDADDLWPTDNLTRHVEVFRTHPHFEVVVGQVQCLRAITPANAATKIRRNIDDDMPNSYLDHELSVSFYSYLFGAAVVKPHVFQTAGWIDELNYFGEDVDWFFRVRESQVVLCQTEHVALHYRRHAESITRVNPINPMLRVLKESLDRRRGSSDSNVQASPIPPAIVSTQAGARQP